MLNSKQRKANHPDQHLRDANDIWQDKLIERAKMVARNKRAWLKKANCHRAKGEHNIANWIIATEIEHRAVGYRNTGHMRGELYLIGG